MKKIIITTLFIVMGLALLSNAYAADKSESIYRSKVNQMINFYQARLYLIDSEYKILADIGKDAEKMINYLLEEKERLVQKMKNNDIELSSIKIKNYISNQARNRNMS